MEVPFVLIVRRLYLVVAIYIFSYKCKISKTALACNVLDHTFQLKKPILFDPATAASIFGKKKQKNQWYDI